MTDRTQAYVARQAWWRALALRGDPLLQIDVFGAFADGFEAGRAADNHNPALPADVTGLAGFLLTEAKCREYNGDGIHELLTEASEALTTQSAALAAARTENSKLRDSLTEMVKFYEEVAGEDECDTEELCGTPICSAVGCVVDKAARARAALAEGG